MSSLRMMAGLAASSAILFARMDVEPGQPAQAVKMIVTVQARNGKQVPVLKQGDVMVFQNKQRLAVTSVVAAANDCAPLELMILIDDASGTSLGWQLNDLRQFIQNQPPETAIGVGYMQNGTIVLGQSLTADHAAAAKALRLPLGSPGVMPSPFLSLSDLIKRWPPSSARHEVVLITSGIDPLGGGISDPYLYTAIEHAQRAGVVVYNIYMPAAGRGGHSWRLEWGQNHLAQIAEETGGEAYMLGFGPPVSFEPYLADISARLSRQYVVNFLIAPRAKAGFQQVRLTTEVPNAELVYAGKVYVPAIR
jgi:hypothetical protein